MGSPPEYWEDRRRVLLAGGAEVWPRQLNASRILSEGYSTFLVGSGLLADAIELVMLDEDERAQSLLPAAELYLRTAIERDDLHVYGRVGQEELGRSQRVRELTLVRWLRSGTLDVEQLRLACGIKESFNEGVFSRDSWWRSGFCGPRSVGRQIPYDRRLLYFYVLGKNFRGEEDPTRVIKLMKGFR
jgi:hypothetical protein